MYRKSSRCASSACVEVDVLKDAVLVRDPKHPETVLAFTAEEWGAFVAGVKAGEFDSPLAADDAVRKD